MLLMSSSFRPIFYRIYKIRLPSILLFQVELTHATWLGQLCNGCGLVSQTTKSVQKVLFRALPLTSAPTNPTVEFTRYNERDEISFEMCEDLSEQVQHSQPYCDLNGLILPEVNLHYILL
jgi:hypothetical protein